MQSLLVEVGTAQSEPIFDKTGNTLRKQGPVATEVNSYEIFGSPFAAPL
jgi:hypothetical protein